MSNRVCEPKPDIPNCANYHLMIHTSTRTNNYHSVNLWMTLTKILSRFARNWALKESRILVEICTENIFLYKVVQFLR